MRIGLEKQKKQKKSLKISIFVFLLLTVVALIIYMWCAFSFKIPNSTWIPHDKLVLITESDNNPFVIGIWAITNYGIYLDSATNEITYSFLIADSDLTLSGIVFITIFSTFIATDLILVILLNYLCRITGIGYINVAYVLLIISFIILLALSLTLGNPLQEKITDPQQQDAFAFFNWGVGPQGAKHSLYLSITSWVMIGTIGFAGFVSLLLSITGCAKLATN